MANLGEERATGDDSDDEVTIRGASVDYFDSEEQVVYTELRDNIQTSPQNLSSSKAGSSRRSSRIASSHSTTIDFYALQRWGKTTDMLPLAYAVQPDSGQRSAALLPGQLLTKQPKRKGIKTKLKTNYGVKRAKKGFDFHVEQRRSDSSGRFVNNGEGFLHDAEYNSNGHNGVVDHDYDQFDETSSDAEDDDCDVTLDEVILPRQTKAQPNVIEPINNQYKIDAASELSLIAMVEGVRQETGESCLLYKCNLCGKVLVELVKIVVHLSLHLKQSAKVRFQCVFCPGLSFVLQAELDLHRRVKHSNFVELDPLPPLQATSAACSGIDSLLLADSIVSQLGANDVMPGDVVTADRKANQVYTLPTTIVSVNTALDEARERGAQTVAAPDGTLSKLNFGSIELVNCKSKKEVKQERDDNFEGAPSKKPRVRGLDSSKKKRRGSKASDSGAVKMADQITRAFGKSVGKQLSDSADKNKANLKCSFCGKAFQRHFSLQRHERVHTGVKPCFCQMCGRGFSEPRNLRHHVIRFHSDGSELHLLPRQRSSSLNSPQGRPRKHRLSLSPTSIPNQMAPHRPDSTKQNGDSLVALTLAATAELQHLNDQELAVSMLTSLGNTAGIKEEVVDQPSNNLNQKPLVSAPVVLCNLSKPVDSNSSVYAIKSTPVQSADPINLGNAFKTYSNVGKMGPLSVKVKPSADPARPAAANGNRPHSEDDDSSLASPASLAYTASEPLAIARFEECVDVEVAG